MRRAAGRAGALAIYLAVLPALGATGCGDDDATAERPTGGLGASARPASTAGTTAAGPVPAARRLDDRHPEGRVLPTKVEPQPIRIVDRVEGAPEGAMPTPPDPASEIRTAIGDPSACLTEADRAIGRDIAFDVEVDVQASGTPARVQVRSPGVSEAARDCVASRVRGGRYARLTRLTTVQTSVVLRRTLPTGP